MFEVRFLLLICAVVCLSDARSTSTTAALTLTTLDPIINEKAPDCVEEGLVIHRCSVGESLNVSVTNLCTNQPSPKSNQFQDHNIGANRDENCTAPQDGRWPNNPYNPHTTNVSRPSGQNLGYLHFQRVCFSNQSVTVDLRKSENVHEQISINGIDRVDFFRTRLQAPLWINATGGCSRCTKPTFLKVHRGTIGAQKHARPSGFLMEPGSAIYIRGQPSEAQEQVSAVVTSNTLTIGAGSKVIARGNQVLLEFDEAPGTRLKPNVTICAMFPIRSHSGLNQIPHTVVTLKNGATADMLSNYVYIFPGSVQAYVRSGNWYGSKEMIPSPAFSDPVSADLTPSILHRNERQELGVSYSIANWKLSDSWLFHDLIAMHRFEDKFWNTNWTFYDDIMRNATEYCLQSMEEINNAIEEAWKDTGSCSTAPVSSIANPTTAATGPEATTSQGSPLMIGVIAGSAAAGLAVLGLSVGGLYYWSKKKSRKGAPKRPRGQSKKRKQAPSAATWVETTSKSVKLEGPVKSSRT